MSFEIIPYLRSELQTLIPISPFIASEGKGFLFYNVVEVDYIDPVESKIVLKNSTNLFSIGDKIKLHDSNGRIFDGEYTILDIKNDNKEYMIDLWIYHDGSIQNQTSARISNITALKIVDIPVSPSPTGVIVDGDYTSIITGNDVLIRSSNEYDGFYNLSSTPELRNDPSVPSGIKNWLEEDMYACDSHLHVTMTYNLKSEKKGGQFYVSPGSDSSQQQDVGLQTAFNHPVMPGKSTYLSFVDGRVRTVFNSLHTPERGMIVNFANYLFPIAFAITFAFPDWMGRGFRNGLLGRALLNFNKLKYGENWKETRKEIRFLRNKILNQNDKIVLIKNTSDYNTYFNGRESYFSSSSNAKLIRFLIHMEGGHQFDMDLYRLDRNFALEDNGSNTLTDSYGNLLYPPHPDYNSSVTSHEMLNSGNDPSHDWYGGFHKTNHIQLCLNRFLSLSQTYDGSNEYAINLIGWTPMHAYWNGMGAQGKMIHDEFMSIITMPRPENYMRKKVYTRDEKGKQYEDDQIRGFRFEKCTRLTELGRQMIKTAFRNGIIIDLKHYHKNARLQILNMAERGFDYNPVYGIFGDPKLNPDQWLYKDELESADPVINPTIDDGIFSVENQNTKNTLSNNKYQIMVTHAALSLVDRNGTNIDNIRQKIDNNETSTLSSFDIPLLPFYEDELRKILNQLYPDISVSYQKHHDINGSPLFFSQPDSVQDIKNKVSAVISTYVDAPKIQEYFEYFFPMFLRNTHNHDNLNIDNYEIERIIKLGGVIGLISEDRVIRSNERMFGKGNRRKKNKAPSKTFSNTSFIDDSSVPYNINLWPMYGSNITEVDGGVDYLAGKPFDFNDLNSSAAWIPFEDELAWNAKGLFAEIQIALDKIYHEYMTKHYGNTPQEWHYYKSFYAANKTYANLFKNGVLEKFKDGDITKPNVNIQAISCMEAFYKAIDHIAKVARLNIYQPLNLDLLPTDSLATIKVKILRFYRNICISSDFDGITDVMSLYASPRLYPVMALYVANRLKWDLYRRYIVDPSIPDMKIGPEKGQTIPIDEGFIMALDNLDATHLNDIVKDIMKQLLDTNFINMIAYAQGWDTP